MGFRTVEVTGSAELHVRSGSLLIEKEIKKEHGFSNTDNSKSRKRSKKEAEIDKIVIPLIIMRRQVYMEKDRADRLWMKMIKVKIENQARALAFPRGGK